MRRGPIVGAVAGLLVVPLAAWLALSISSDDEKRDAPAPKAAGGGSARRVAPAVDAGDGVIATARALAQRDPKRSRAVLREALEERPSDPRLLEALARKLLIDDSPEARGLAERCVKARPGYGACEELYRRAIDPRPRDDRTSKFLDDCLASDEGRVPCLASVVVERLRAGDVDGASQALEPLERAGPEHALARLSRARVLSARGSYRAALATFGEVCETGQAYACYRAQALRADGW